MNAHDESHDGFHESYALLEFIECQADKWHGNGYEMHMTLQPALGCLRSDDAFLSRLLTIGTRCLSMKSALETSPGSGPILISRPIR